MLLVALFAAHVRWAEAFLVTPPRCRTVVAVRSWWNGIRVDVYEGKVAVQWDVRYDRISAPSLEPGMVEVRDTGDERGRGAFATRAICAGSFLGAYEGEELSLDELRERYGDDEPEYVLRVDADLYIDGRDAARSAQNFTPAHLNHDATRPNVVRYCSQRRDPATVDFFTARDVQPGEELCFDYGPEFWRLRAIKPMQPDEDDLRLKFEKALDTQWFDPNSSRDAGPVVAWLKARYHSSPTTFEAAYIAIVLSSFVFIAELIVRWYKYNVWAPAADHHRQLADLIDQATWGQQQPF